MKRIRRGRYSQILFRQAAAEFLLLGIAVGIVHGRVRHAFFSLFPTVRENYRESESGGQRVQEIHHAVSMILAEPPAAFAVLERSFDDEMPVRVVEQWLDFLEERPTVVSGIRENGIELFYAQPFRARDFWRFGDGVIAGRLGSLDLFACLSSEQLAQLAEPSTVQHFLSGERVVRQGDGGEDLYVILDGKAEVSVQHEALKKSVGALEAGQCFGEMSLLTGEPRLATVVASTNLDILAVGHWKIKKVLQEDKTLVDKIGAIVEKRQSATQAVQDELSRRHASLAAGKQQRSLTERIQNYLWAVGSRDAAKAV